MSSLLEICGEFEDSWEVYGASSWIPDICSIKIIQDSASILSQIKISLNLALNRCRPTFLQLSPQSNISRSFMVRQLHQ
jgi:hypothetical protein